MTSESTSLPPLDTWQAQLLRLTVFPTHPEGMPDRDFWRELVGRDAEASTRKKLVRTDEGPVDDKGFTVTIDPQRIDLSFFPLIDPLNPPSGIPVIGPFTASHSACDTYFRRFLKELSPPIKRLAFGGVLIQPTDSHEAGYRQLNEYLHDVNLEPASSDFNYRINRRRVSRSLQGEVVINRLTTWSLAKWSLELQSSGPTLATTPTSEGYGCRLEFDLNTDAARVEPLPPDHLLSVWDELVAMCQEIAQRGDVP